MIEMHRDASRLACADALLLSLAALEREIDELLEIGRKPSIAPPPVPAKTPPATRAPRARGDKTQGREIGLRIRAARSARGLTQLDLSTATGIRRPNIARLERGGNTPTIETLQRIAQALETTVSSLVTGN
jgi:DNA-binding XRE family transcriptional regulator